MIPYMRPYVNSYVMSYMGSYVLIIYLGIKMHGVSCAEHVVGCHNPGPQRVDEREVYFLNIARQRESPETYFDCMAYMRWEITTVIDSVLTDFANSSRESFFHCLVDKHRFGGGQYPVYNSSTFLVH